MKKQLTKVLATILSFAMLLSVVSITASAAIIDSGTCGENLTWTLDDNGTLTISGTGDMYEYDQYVSPWYWYGSDSSVKSAIISDGVTNISPGAFANCSGLQEITVSDSVKSIGMYAFEDCVSLHSITIPDSVTVINMGAFRGCSKLQNVTLGRGLTSTGSEVFSGCSNLQNVIIPDSITSIGGAAFWNCSSLKSLTLPDSVTIIGDYAFEGCSSLQDVSIPAFATYIGSWAFSGCSSIQSFVIPASIESIYRATFSGCSSLQSIVIPDSVTSIEFYAFNYCSSLADVYYEGTEEQWNKIIIEDRNADLVNANMHFDYHTHIYSKVLTLPTCTEKGYTTYTCACGHSYKDNEINAKGHTYTSKVTKQSTYTAEGVETFTCSCGHSYTKAIAKLIPTFTDSASAVVKGNNITMVSGINAAALLVQASDGTKILDKDGKNLATDKLVATGMTLVMPDGSKKEIVVYGDGDGDGKITSADARYALRASVGLEKTTEASCYYKAANVDGDKLSSSDARAILRASVGLEDSKKWMK